MRSLFAHQNVCAACARRSRVTLPYTEEQWERILSLGCQVDREIRDGDIRLTMGGEPTSCLSTTMEGAEWNAAAQGPRSGYWRTLAGPPRDRLPRADCSTTGKANGIPASLCRAGPSHAIGGPMARRCGGIVNCWPARR